MRKRVLPDLIIEECIPSCDECPLIWINEKLGHRIACHCMICQHHTRTDDGQPRKKSQIRLPPQGQAGLAYAEISPDEEKHLHGTKGRRCR